MRSLGEKAEDLLGAEIFKTLKPYLDRCLAGETVSFQKEFTLKGCGKRFMDVIYTPFKDKQDLVKGILVTSETSLNVKISRRKEQNSRPRQFTIAAWPPLGNWLQV